MTARLLGVLAALGVAAALVLGWALWSAQGFERQFDADYVGSDTCGTCHTVVHAHWARSPHANMIHTPSPDTVIGDFDGATYALPQDSPDPLRGQVVARAYRRGGQYIMALRHPDRATFVEFPIRYVVGYQYRQEYVTPEAGGVLRRLPLQWSTATQSFFPYWNRQEGSPQTLDDLWAQMRTTNSAWNVYCARCHVTNHRVHDTDRFHTRAEVGWLETGIGCEACHGPGSLHSRYMQASPANRLAMWLRSRFTGRPVAYIASAARLPKGQALSVCARCHGADIYASNQDIYRRYEPGYSREGRINDLSAYFRQTPLTPGRSFPTLEIWANGAPKGIGMLFRSFIESDCYQQAETRCHDCHNPHDNKQPAVPGILQASDVSDRYCLGCHAELAAAPEAHSRHVEGEPGSFCMDCHMPRHITKLNRGVWERTRTHDMSSVPAPEDSVRLGLAGAPNACNDCHSDRDAAWALAHRRQWGRVQPR